jgi:structural maintenance of chromosome 1
VRLFKEAYEHVSGVIDSVYKSLTEEQGTAYLSLDDPDEPYLGGVRYNAMPPSKTFRDIDQLSGGEKAVAALALLFAIHSYRPSPFFILDEIDAALDMSNVAVVAQYLKQKAQDLQIILISLKDKVYDKTDALVGIYHDTALVCSKSITLDLTQFSLQ